MAFSISVTFGDGREEVATDGVIPDGTYTIAGDDTDQGKRVLAVWSDSAGEVVASADSAQQNGE